MRAPPPLNQGKIIIISGPSGSGKTTLYKKLLESGRFKKKLVKSVSITTRPRRPGERSGRDYSFATRKEFRRKIKADYFLEWQKVFDNYYGTPRRPVERLLKEGRNVLLCIDVNGAACVSRRYPQAIKIFITAPSLAVLKRRLKARGSEIQKDMKLRLERARKELAQAKVYDYAIVNDHLSEAFKKLEAIVKKSIDR